MHLGGGGESLSYCHCNWNFMNMLITGVAILIYLTWSCNICYINIIFSLDVALECCTSCIHVE